MSDQLKGLVELQRLDDKLAEIQAKEKELPAEILSLETALKKEKRLHEEQKENLEQSRRKQRDLEKKLQESVEQIRTKQSRLLQAKTNEEYRALQKEIEYTQESNSAMEDDVLRLYEQLDEQEKAFKDGRRALKEKEEQFNVDRGHLEKSVEEARIEQELQLQERKRICDLLDPGYVAEYEKIRSRRNGLAVVVVRNDDVCPGCHMKIMAQTVNEVLQTGEVRHCPHCRRILCCRLDEETGEEKEETKAQEQATE